MQVTGNNDQEKALQEWLYNTLRDIWFAGGNQDTLQPGSQGEEVLHDVVHQEVPAVYRLW